MAGEKNANMKVLEMAACEADRTSLDAHRAAHEAARRAGELHAYCAGIRGELNRIEAKKTLGIKLTERERALWVLYGKDTSKGGR